MKLTLTRIEEPFVMELQNESGNTCVMDANPTIGGKGLGFRPMELLAGSLAGCASIDVINILKKQRVEPSHFSIDIQAKRKEGIPSPFEAIQLIFHFDQSVNLEKVNKIIDMTLQKYCSVSASLNKQIEITYETRVI
jgi:putative redox protein